MSKPTRTLLIVAFSLSPPPAMRLSRAILAAFFALLFVVSTNSCALAAVFENGDACCENERVPGQSDDQAPCRSGTCAPCATLESGVNLAALAPVSVPQAGWTESNALSELLRKSAEIEAATQADPPLVSPPLPPPVWRLDVTTALPVRGPSLAV